MIIKSARLILRLPLVSSLKDKRQISRGLIGKLRNKFNISIAEVARQDAHRALVLGLSLVSGEEAHGQNSLDEILRFVEDYLDTTGAGELVEVELW
ncbi:MAG: DUF503 domain-containing protein [Clostridiales bacterium]|jgi:uncharacterized protein YlxP (DUF503 family)|nr:DUF503 domain-containing protein [Clostridiales bacterium]